MPTNEEHRASAEAIIERTYPITKELRTVPEAGIARGMRRVSQSERRNELGKQLHGLYALAQVHATLALGSEPKPAAGPVTVPTDTAAETWPSTDEIDYADAL